jgi:hypothetical protein
VWHKENAGIENGGLKRNVGLKEETAAKTADPKICWQSPVVNICYVTTANLHKNTAETTYLRRLIKSSIGRAYLWRSPWYSWHMPWTEALRKVRGLWRGGS